MEWLSKFLSSLFVSLLSWWRDAYREDKMRAAEVTAATLEKVKSSVKTVEALERAMREIPTPAPPTVEEWNIDDRASKPPVRLVLTTVLVLLVFVPGCITRTIFVPDKWPEIPTPDRPTLDASTPFTPREQMMAGYTVHLERLIETYNTHAKQHNTAHDY